MRDPWDHTFHAITGRHLGGTMWVYIRSEPGLWTVGFYSPDGKWHSDSDHVWREDAATRTAWLNGSHTQEER